jgi:hypothetical protein
MSYFPPEIIIFQAHDNGTTLNLSARDSHYHCQAAQSKGKKSSAVSLRTAI